MSSQKTNFFEKPKDGEPWDVVIIGSGPAGLTAAIYTCRGAASTLVLAGDNWGGQLMLTTEVDNFPGFSECVQGPDLMNLMRSQAERFGAEIIQKDVESVDFTKTPKEVVAGGVKYLAKSVIIATGADTKWLGVPGEDRLRGRGVSSCAPCDAPFFKNKEVIVVGGGDSAMEEALVLTKYASHVTILHRRNEFKASAAMQARVFAEEKTGKIRIIWNNEITEFVGDKKLEKVKVKDVTTGKEDELPTDGVFVAIGHTPSTKALVGKVELDAKGYVKKAEDELKTLTNVEGVFVAGDVHDYVYRQAITAAGYGCMAGMDVLKFLDKNTPTW
jgi:thioredoxin reductase (NADPH)